MALRSEIKEGRDLTFRKTVPFWANFAWGPQFSLADLVWSNEWRAFCHAFGWRI